MYYNFFILFPKFWSKQCNLFCLLQLNVEAAEPSCVWYGICNDDPEKIQYCPYNGPAKEISQDAIPLLQKWCPKVLDELGGEFEW